MNVLESTVLVWLGSLPAGFLGALTGLGGGSVAAWRAVDKYNLSRGRLKKLPHLQVIPPQEMIHERNPR